jgi:hypothetical protein
MSRGMPLGACWCPSCNQLGNPPGEDDHTPVAQQPDPWAEVA